MSDDVSADLVASYTALEKAYLEKADEGEKIRWFQARAISAEEANRRLSAQVTRDEVIKEFPLVDAEDLAGLKSKEEMKSVATRLTAKLEKAKVAGQTEVEEAVKEALKASDEQIKTMQKAYGRARTPQAGDVVGSQAQAVADSKSAGLIPDQGEDLSKFTGVDRVNKEIEKAVGPMLDRLGLRER